MSSPVEVLDVWETLTHLLKGDAYSSSIEVIRVVMSIVEGDAKAILLEQIATDVRRQLNAYLEDGKDHLSDAKRASSLENRKKFLLDARNSFVMAANRSIRPLDARAMEYVAICHVCLGERESATHWFAKAYETLRKHHEEVKSQVEFHEGFLGQVAYFLKLAVPLVGPAMSSSQNDEYLNNLMDLFEIEKQAKHLQCVVENYNVNAGVIIFYFPYNTVRISTCYARESSRRKHVRHLCCYDKSGKFIKSIRAPVI